MKNLILASGSPRRKALMEDAELDFEIIISPAEELHDDGVPFWKLCEENAKRKAIAVSRVYSESLVVGADTLVSIDKRPLGKPKNEEEAVKMLKMLSGRTQEVCTGVCLARGEETNSFHEITEVVFKELTDEIIASYMSKVNVMDKAGAYAIQEYGEMIIEEIKGDYANVVGLPISLLLRKMNEMKG